jgi:hypothetical protein
VASGALAPMLRGQRSCPVQQLQAAPAAERQAQGWVSNAVALLSDSHSDSSANIDSSWPRMLRTASAPSARRSGGFGASRAVRMALAALAGSPAWLPWICSAARVRPTVLSYSGIGVDT